MAFRDRSHAGRALAQALRGRQLDDAIVIGLARGGVPVAAEVARALDLPLDVGIVRKLGVPWQPELAVGAIASGGVRVINEDVTRALGIEPEVIEALAEWETAELARREETFRAGQAALEVEGKTAILVDDGLATGASMIAAVEAMRRRGAKRVVVAVPIAPPETCNRLRALADEVVCLEQPRPFFGVGQFYDRFAQLSDAEVMAALRGVVHGDEDPAPTAVAVRTADAVLDGDLVVPTEPVGLVLFAHGSGSGRRSPRNRSVAAALQRAGLATLLFDLLTPTEERIDRELRFDIDLLAGRLIGATAWARAEERIAKLPIGYFGASTGGAAALIAAAATDEPSAIVSRGGRPDLAGDALERVRAPTLLVVGGDDGQVVALNRRALARLRCAKQLAIVPGATHLFEEPGALEQVAELATAWLVRHLAPHRVAA